MSFCDMDTNSSKIRIENYLQTGKIFHVARTQIRSNSAVVVHSHDFLEVFLVEEGEGVHGINGKRQRLWAGSIVFIRPHDSHSIQSFSDGSLTIVNCAFPTSVGRELFEQFGNEVSISWRDHPRYPQSARIDTFSRVRLTTVFNEAFQSTHSRLDLAWLLLTVLRETNKSALRYQIGTRPPGWLHRAIEVFIQDPRFLEDGRREFVRIIAKSREHVNRSLQKYYGRTLSQFVNDARLEHASFLLRTTDYDIVSICGDVGFSNISHFYRLFRARYFVSPGEYRDTARKLLGLRL